MTVLRRIIGATVPGRPQETWEFADPDCPIRLTATPTGEGGAPFAHAMQKNVGEYGETWKDSVWSPNMITLQVRIDADPADWLSVWDRWRASLGEGPSLCRYEVQSAGGGVRWQDVRLHSAVEGGGKPARDAAAPDVLGVGWETVVLQSDYSLWQKTPTYSEFLPAQFATATLTNDGDLPSWPRYRLFGRGGYTLGVAGEAVELPLIQPGDWWEIETNPQYPHIRDQDGVDVWDTLGAGVGFYEPVPPGGVCPLTLTGINLDATAKVQVWLPQLYRRPKA